MVDIDKIVREVLTELGQPPGGVNPPDLEPADIARRLEHSLLTVGMTQDELSTECRMARSLRVGVVCVAPYYVADAVALLAGSGVSVCAAVGFPSAFLSTEAKMTDVRVSVMQGAAEIDLAIDVAAVKSGDMARAEKDFRSAVEIAGGVAVVKAVFEHGSYTETEKEAVLRMIGRSGVPFVKIQNMTSGHGARTEEIQFVKGLLGNKVDIKIDGGVKTLPQALELFGAGAARIGLTATKTLVEQAMAEYKATDNRRIPR